MRTAKQASLGLDLVDQEWRARRGSATLFHDIDAGTFVDDVTLLNFTYDTLKNEFGKAQVTVGTPMGCVIYQGRHGGPSRDMAHKASVLQ